MDGGTRRVADSSDAALRRTSDVATAHSRDARAQSFLPEIDDLGRRSWKAVAAVKLLSIQRPRGPHVKDRRVPGHVVRNAREALTTAGYKGHEARAAVERALAQLDDQVTLPQLDDQVTLPQLDDQVTLPQLIRQALRCCAIAHR